MSAAASRRCSVAALMLALGAAPAVSQTRPIAFPTGNTGGTMGNWGPLGEACTGASAEARTHILFPAQFLPPRPGVVWGLEHVPTWLMNAAIPNCPMGLYTVQYSLLEITLAHRARGLGPLSLTFANNLPVPPPPPVLPAQAVTMTWTTGTWNQIAFVQPFAYDGVSDVVVEIRKVVSPSGQNVGTLRNLNPPRANLPVQVMAVGGVGSNANIAASGSAANLLGWRLRFDNVPHPTLEVRSPLGPLQLHYEHGTACHYRLYATTNDLFAIMLSLGLAPAPLIVLPGAGGVWLNLPAATLVIGVVTPAAGQAFHQHNFNIPVAPPVFTGLLLGAQAATLSPSAQALFTNAVDFVIQ